MSVLKKAEEYVECVGFIITFPRPSQAELVVPLLYQLRIIRLLADVIEVQVDAISQGSKVLLVDDLLATGGSLRAAVSLIEKAGGDVAEAFTLIELAYLSPRKHIPEHIPIYSLITLTE
ncbi:unnamed protein product [Gongylonema pulchrum]|uniref:adenine phosphoribosyltransferase n=1 Tax=Gongylonema pulchrum TaxID=637853 RepID=A0A183E1K6_9BILA|nr:unnamed protein product [Gongylonema pulchrum]